MKQFNLEIKELNIQTGLWKNSESRLKISETILDYLKVIVTR